MHRRVLHLIRQTFELSEGMRTNQWHPAEKMTSSGPLGALRSLRERQGLTYS